MRRYLRLGLAAAAAVLVMCTAGAGAAQAGTWMQVSCENPGGTAAPSEGWSTGTSGGAGITSAQCSPGSPMRAELSFLAPAPAGSVAYLQYQPPAGSTLVGGTVDGTFSADGYGNNSSGQVSAVAEARLSEPALGNVFFQCVAWVVACGNGPDYSGRVALPRDAGGDLVADANCSSSTGISCNLNAKNNAWALDEIYWARLLLSSSVSPQGSGFSGSGLQPRVRGTGHVVFTASEPTGPGIYQVAVALDGRTVWAGTPTTNGGKCVPVGTDPSGALMFDYEQPCLASEVVDVPVPTRGLPDGAHELAIAVTDAAHNSATVLDQTITTSNPQRTPVPHGRGALRARFVISWHWSGATTRLRSISVSHLPRASGLSAVCTGPRCPRIRPRHVNAPQVGRLLHALKGIRLHTGDRLHLTVSERHHRPERILLTIRAGLEPLARLVR